MRETFLLDIFSSIDLILFTADQSRRPAVTAGSASAFRIDGSRVRGPPLSSVDSGGIT